MNLIDYDYKQQVRLATALSFMNHIIAIYGYKLSTIYAKIEYI